MLYQYDCFTDYNPSPDLEKIKAPLYAVNSADDEVNPPELGILEREIKKVAHGRYILIPTSDETRGHGTHSRAGGVEELPDRTAASVRAARGADRSPERRVGRKPRRRFST